MKKSIAAIALAVPILLAGCAVTTPEVTLPEASQAAETTVSAAAIKNLDDAIEWARGAGGDISSEELRSGIQALTANLPDDLWFQDSNTLGQDLISLNFDAFDKKPGELISELNRIVDFLETALKNPNRS